MGAPENGHRRYVKDRVSPATRTGFRTSHTQLAVDDGLAQGVDREVPDSLVPERIEHALALFHAAAGLDAHLEVLLEELHHCVELVKRLSLRDLPSPMVTGPLQRLVWISAVRNRRDCLMTRPFSPPNTGAPQHTPEMPL
jgi:hypothetical protein